MFVVDKHTLVVPAGAPKLNVWDSYDTPVKYGFEDTHVNSSQFFDNEVNYLGDNGDVIESQLSEMGLPFHERDFWGGNEYDILFFKNHGLIAKIGKNHDPIDLIHPCFSQAIGWLSDEETGITTCLYAGERLTPAFTALAPDANRYGNPVLEKALASSGQKAGDITDGNVGYVQVDGVDYPYMIDVDQNENGTIDRSVARRKQKLKKRLWDREGFNNADSHQQILFQMYVNNKKLTPWMGQMERHQPLRHLYWTAMQAPTEKRGPLLKKLWDEAAVWTRGAAASGARLHQDYLKPHHS